MSDIRITCARTHNLRGVDAVIPRNSLTVITGLSGSGKSSLAFDTLYAEGQRRYVESLSAYARQFLDRLQKPDVERIEGLSPAIAIEQRTTAGNPRSVVATVTEIHDYLRILWGAVAKAHCPKCGRPVVRQSAEQIVEAILKFPPSARFILFAPVVKGRKGRHEDVFATLARAGVARVRVDGAIYPLDEVPPLEKTKAHSIEVVVDRLAAPAELPPEAAYVTRLTDSVELALKLGSGLCTAEILPRGGEPAPEPFVFSEKNACPECGISFDELKARSFSFNSPYGACPECGGLGSVYYFDEDLIIPDKSLPFGACVHPWRRAGHMGILYYKEILERLSVQYGVSLHTPYEKLPESFRKGFVHGFSEPLVLPWRKEQTPFPGVLETVKHSLETAETDERRAKFEAYRSEKTCPACGGARLRPESRAARVAGRTIVEVMAMPVTEAKEFFDALFAESAAEGSEYGPVREVLKEISKRLGFLVDVGLDYLALDRASSTLSGGEMQRIRLASQIGSGLVGVLYVLDEPTIGLHPRDNEKLIAMLRALRDRGNTVVVVEHDGEMMRTADWIIDLGPGAGREGGEIVYQGPYAGLLEAKTLTADYLSGRKGFPQPAPLSVPAAKLPMMTITGCSEHNLKNVTAHFPLGAFTVVTGVSGSGKSTLVEKTLKRALMRKFGGSKLAPGKHRRLTGAEKLDKIVEIDQSPIGRTPRSNPATYVGLFDEIRRLFAETPAAKMRGYGPGRFSFNVKGGRCETCGGDGVRKLEMSFLPDVYVTCEQCGGRRFNKETLEVKYGGKNIAEVLDMTVAEAHEFFAKVPRLAAKLGTLVEVGLGYIGLGQSATTLSGGEAQRIKLAFELSRRSTGRTLYLLDEPTTGLHFDDVAKLMALLMRLRDAGNTILVIEHNVEVMKSADWIVDLGPGGGGSGGTLVCEGPPSLVKACPLSATAAFL